MGRPHRRNPHPHGLLVPVRRSGGGEVEKGAGEGRRSSALVAREPAIYTVLLSGLSLLSFYSNSYNGKLVQGPSPEEELP